MFVYLVSRVFQYFERHKSAKRCYNIEILVELKLYTNVIDFSFVLGFVLGFVVYVQAAYEYYFGS